MLVHLLALAVAAATPAPARKLFEIQDPRVVESSGIVASDRRDDVFFTHNDSGDSARFFAVDRHGCTLGVVNAAGVEATDWEDVARGPGPDGTPSLFLGDIGDNGKSRPEIVVHRFAEPDVGPAGGGTCPDAPETAVTPASFRLAYEDGPHDAETLLVHPRTGQVFVVTKDFSGPEALYAAPVALDPGAVNTLHKVAPVSTPDGFFAATAGDIAPDGSSVAVRGYGDIYVWRISGGDVPAAFAGKPERLPAPDLGKQGEGLGYTRDGKALVTSSEGQKAPVHLVPLPCRRRDAVTLGVPSARRATATIDGAPARATVGPGRVRVSLADAIRASGRATVRVRVRTRSGRRVTVTRHVAVCLA